MMKIKKIGLLSLTALLALSLVGCSNKEKTGSNPEEQKKFDAFINTQFVNTMQDDYLSMHIYTEKPQNFGIDKSKVKVQIGDRYDDEMNKKSIEKINNNDSQFKKFNRDDLTDVQKETYDIYAYMLNLNKVSLDEKFKYMDFSFSTITGIHTQIPTLFADLTLRNEEDVKDLITLVKDTLPYMNSILEYTKKQAKENLMMIDIDNVIEYSKKIKDAGLKSSTLTSMNNNIAALTLDDAKTKAYQKEVTEAFETSFLPAYDAIIKTLSSLKSEKNNMQGLSYLKNGKEYYELLFKNATGTDKDITKVKSELQTLASSSLMKVQVAAAKNEKLYNEYSEGKITTKYKDFETMLVDLDKDIKKDFPSVGKLNYEVKPLDKDLANSGIAAYFNLPAIDGTTPKQIRVNTKEDSLKINALETFSTIAHEGIPGHMYQISYAYENLTNPWRKVAANFRGYQEGYATYVELYSLKYLKDIDPLITEIQQNLMVYQNSIISLVDIGIHYEGWTKDQTKKFIVKNGLDKNASDPLYNQIQANPTSFLSYYVGYAEVASLREKAQKALGNKFKEIDFHTAILKSGSAPFKVVEANVDAYIKKEK